MMKNLRWMDLKENALSPVDGYPIDCDWCGEPTSLGWLLWTHRGIEFLEECESCSVRTRIGARQ